MQGLAAWKKSTIRPPLSSQTTSGAPSIQHRAQHAKSHCPLFTVHCSLQSEALNWKNGGAA
jgi:hypothetical protein